MAIAQVIAGAYTSTYGAVGMGYTRDGFQLFIDSHGEMVNETDLWGDSVLDIVHRGSSCRIVTECKVQNTGGIGNILAFYPWGGLGTISTTAAPIGRLGSNVASSLVLTVVANTPAAAAGTPGGPTTLTASKAILAPNSNLSLLLTSKARNVPINLQCLPSETGGTTTYFVTT